MEDLDWLRKPLTLLVIACFGIALAYSPATQAREWIGVVAVVFVLYLLLGDS